MICSLIEYKKLSIGSLRDEKIHESRSWSCFCQETNRGFTWMSCFLILCRNKKLMNKLNSGPPRNSSSPWPHYSNYFLRCCQTKKLESSSLVPKWWWSITGAEGLVEELEGLQEEGRVNKEGGDSSVFWNEERNRIGTMNMNENEPTKN